MNSIVKICASSAYFACVFGLRIPSNSGASFVQMDALPKEVKVKELLELEKIAEQLKVNDPRENDALRQGLRSMFGGGGSTAAASAPPARPTMPFQELKNKNTNHTCCVV